MFFWMQNIIGTQSSISKSARRIEMTSHSFQPQWTTDPLFDILNVSQPNTVVSLHSFDHCNSQLTLQNKIVIWDDKTQSPDQVSGYHDDDVSILLTMQKHLIRQNLGQIRCANVIIVFTIPMHLAVQKLKSDMFSPSDAFS